jgi:GNAT superfamily N-acetyltransferase
VPDRVREATVADLETILLHRRRMCEDMGYREAGLLEAIVDGSREPLRRWLTEGVYRGWLVERDGEVVAGGGIIVTPFLPGVADQGLERATILNVYTEAAYRRQGLARALMDRMIGWCRERGFQTVTLDASEDGRRLYESLGFRPTPQMRLALRRG